MSMNPERAKLEELAAKVLEDSHTVMEPPRIRPFDEPEHLPKNNNFTMSSGITRTPNGKLWVSWFGGEDGPKAFLLLASSDDDGQTWSNPKYIIKEPLTPHGFNRSVLGGNLWTDPQGRMWCFFTYYISYFDGRGGVWCSVCDNPDDDELVWSTPKRICNGFILNKPFILSNEEWLLPTSLWCRERMNHILGLGPSSLYRELDDMRTSNFYVSSDQGTSWEYRGSVAGECKEFDEPVFIEKSNGELQCYLRRHPGLHEAISIDFGKTWSIPVPSILKHCSARIFTKRLQSGKLLLVKHGPLYEQTGRSHMTAYLSDDDGENWYGGLMIDERESVSYPDGFQTPDGRIYVAYDRKRIDGEILLAIFTEDDIVKGEIVNPNSKLKIPVQQSGTMKPE